MMIAKESTVRMLPNYWKDFVVESRTFEHHEGHWMWAYGTYEDTGQRIMWWTKIAEPPGSLPIWAKDVALEAFNKHRNLRQ